MKKLTSLLLALAVVLALAVPALAAGTGDAALADGEGTLTGGSIIIDGAIPGQTYQAYQILYLESYKTVVDETTHEVTDGNYAYKANSAWLDWLKNQTTYVTVDEQGYVSWVYKEVDGEKVPADAVAFAKLARDYAKENNIKPVQSAVAPAATGDETTSTVTLDKLKLGYYLVDSSLGALCVLDTTNPKFEMEEKNEQPTIDKKVQEDSKIPAAGATEDISWGATNDADIGQTVNFKTVVHAKIGAGNYVVHDKMSEGLTLVVDSIKVEGATKDTDYTVNTNVTHYKKDASGNVTTEVDYTCDFEIVFKQAYLDKITEGKGKDETVGIVITYSATLNDKADANGSTNDTQLTYGDENFTTWVQTVTYTWKMSVLKYGNGEETNLLKGAQFVLLNKAKDKVATVVDGKVTGWVAVPTAEEGKEITWPVNTIMTTGDDGTIAIQGLDADNYYLREVKAPDGYNKVSEDREVTIRASAGADGKWTQTEAIAKINNQSGTELPDTGGTGTTVFYVLGGTLVLAAVVLLVTKKRMGREK